MTGSVSPKLPRHLHDAGDGRQRRLGRPGEDTPHRHHRVQRRRTDRRTEKMRARPTPKAMPAIAPMNSDGANTPPDPPIDRVRLAATILPIRKSKISPTTTCPAIT